MVGVSRAPESQDSNSFSRWLHRQQTEDLRHTIQRVSRGKGAAVIIVVSRQKLKKELERKICKRSFWKGHWRKPPVTVTTIKHLQDTITEVSDHKRTTGLTIIAMERISRMFFRVESPRISTLRVLRGDEKIMPQCGLFISGASEFDGTHLADWKNRLHDDKDLRLGRGVHISLDYETSRPMSEENETLPPEEQQQEQDPRRQVPEPDEESGWWSRWKPWVSGCVGLVVASAVLSIKGGIPTTSTYFQATAYGIKVTAATFTTGASVGACVAPVMCALAIGAFAALVVYYIPYGNVYSWLGKQWRNFLSGLCKLWSSWGDGSEDRFRVPPMVTI